MDIFESQSTLFLHVSRHFLEDQLPYVNILIIQQCEIIFGGQRNTSICILVLIIVIVVFLFMLNIASFYLSIYLLRKPFYFSLEMFQPPLYLAIVLSILTSHLTKLIYFIFGDADSICIGPNHFGLYVVLIWVLPQVDLYLGQYLFLIFFLISYRSQSIQTFQLHFLAFCHFKPSLIHIHMSKLTLYSLERLLRFDNLLLLHLLILSKIHKYFSIGFLILQILFIFHHFLEVFI